MPFDVENVTERIYRITMPYVCMYLIVGEEKAILLDTGWGYGDLRGVVESLTDLPITLVLSHAHPDHIGGAAQFGEAYLHEADFHMIESQANLELRQRLMDKYAPSDFESNPDLWLESKSDGYIPLDEDKVFDLGGITLMPFRVPGHSPGSMVFILPEERIAIFGDAVSHPTLVVFDNSSSIQEHYEGMVKLQDYNHLYDRVFVNHETFELDKMVLENNIALAKNILDGTDEKIAPSSRTQKMSTNGSRIFAARERKPWLPSDPKDIGNIYYRADKV